MSKSSITISKNSDAVIQNEAGLDAPGRQTAQDAVDQSCLASAGVAGQDRKTLSFQDCIGQASERLTMLRRQI
jgi:hypothetical protein